MSNSVVYYGRAAYVRKKLTTTAAIDVYTCPTEHVARVVWLRCTNTSAGAINITVFLVDSGAVTYTFYATQALAAAASIEFDWNIHPLAAGEKLQVQASGADTIQVLGTVMETSVSRT